MKKWFLICCTAIAVLISCVYILIPATLNISGIHLLSCTESGASRYLTDTAKWQKWWPADKAKQNTGAAENSAFTYGGYTFLFTKKFYNTTGVIIKNESININSTISVLPLLHDSSAVQWQCVLLTGTNPFTRVQRYLQANDIKKNMDSILNVLARFLSKTENVYTTAITQIKVTDTLLVGTKKVFAKYPSTEDVYGLLKPLSDYIARNNIKETGYPMLHVNRADSTHFETMVAIPVLSEPLATKDFFIKRMAPGKILVTGEIKGGDYAAALAYEQLANYVHDYHRVSPAIPFQSLITDRSAEPDTAKWITKIYYPVF